MPKNSKPKRKTTKTSRIQAGQSKRRKTKDQGRRPGKPTISDDELIEQRDRWAYALDAHWGEVGWNLRCARTIEHIRIALQPLSKGSSLYPLSLLLRPTTETANPKAMREAKEAFAMIDGSFRETQNTHRKANEAFQKAQSAVLELSDKNKEYLQGEIKRRKENIRELQIKISGKNAEIRRNELHLKKAARHNRASIETELQSLRSEPARFQADISNENGVIAELGGRLRLLTPENRKLADETHAERKTSLDAAMLRLSGIETEYKRREGRLADLQADYCQCGLLKFIRGRRYAHSPRNLANAIAGLPIISCRQSATRCAKIPYTWEPICTVFEFVENTWQERKRSDRTDEQIFTLFRKAIAALPRTLLGQPDQDGKRKRLDNYFRRDLCEKWHYLKQAIREALRVYSHPDQVPYLIEAKFKENQGKPRTGTDDFFAEHDSLEF